MTTPTVLLPYQQRWVAEQADVALWSKSRRIGASWCDASDSVLYASAENGQDALYIGYSEDMTREYIDDCAMWAKAFSVAASAADEFLFEEADERGEKNAIKAFRIDFASGHKVLALSSRPRSIRGKQGKVTIDEAAFHDDLPGLMKAALAMLIWGGKVRLLSSHNGEGNYFNELVLQVRANRVPYALHETTIDDALEDGLYQRICLTTGKPWSQSAQVEWRKALFDRYRDNADEELLCIPSAGSGIWLSRALIDARMKLGKVLRYTAPEGMALWPEHVQNAAIDDWIRETLDPEILGLDVAMRHVMGVDFGRHVDLSVFAALCIDAGLKKSVPILAELAKVPYTAQKRIALHLARRLPRFSHAKLDRGGNGDFLAEEMTREFGAAMVEGVALSEKWYRENTAPFKADLEDAVLTLPRDAAIADDLAAFRKVRGVPRVPDLRVATGESGAKRHGDAGIALLMAHAASRVEFVDIEFQPLGRTRPARRLGDYLGAMA